jgi:signal transduction histidine kinase
MLYLTDRFDGQPFDEADEWLVEMMAGYAALAIAGAQLSDQHSRLRMLEERERIGMELHDGVIQSLYGLGMQLDLMRMTDTLSNDNVGEVIGQLNQVIEDIRRYILDLQSARTLTVRECLRVLLNRLYVPGSLQVVLDAPDEPPPFAASIMDALCQVANEAISNAIRHASATRLTISTRQESQDFQIIIVDDGKGFDPAALGEHSGLGLRNMIQRARQLNGHIDIESAPDAGTKLTITVPVAQH